MARVFCLGRYFQDRGKLIFNNSYQNLSTKILNIVGYRDVILTSLPETLKVLTIFEDFNEDYIALPTASIILPEGGHILRSMSELRLHPLEQP